MLALVGSSSIRADEDFRPLFNGKDLSGWVPVNVAPETFTVRDGMIVSTGKPTGVMRTDRQYENFVIELEWRHMQPGGNAGLFVWSDALPAVGVPFTRSFEVQILDGHDEPNYTSHGDVFGIWGATMTPDRPHPAGWMRCLPHREAGAAVPRMEPLPRLLPGRRAQARRQRQGGLRRQPIASRARAISASSRRARNATSATSASRNCPPPARPPAETATLDEGFVSLYSGLDLRGWRSDPGHAGHWRPSDSILDYDGKSTAKEKDLWTEKAYGDFVLIADWRLPGKPAPRPRAVVLPNGDDAKNADGSAKTLEIPYAGDSGILLRGMRKAQVNITCNTIGSGELYDYRVDKTMPAEVRAGSIPKVKADSPPGKWNRFVITLKKDRVTVILNGQTVIDHVQLPGIPARGPIGLQHHGDPVQFTNLFIKELSGP